MYFQTVNAGIGDFLKSDLTEQGSCVNDDSLAPPPRSRFHEVPVRLFELKETLTDNERRRAEKTDGSA